MTRPVETTASHLEAIAPHGADIELDVRLDRMYVQVGETLWWAPLSAEVCS